MVVVLAVLCSNVVRAGDAPLCWTELCRRRRVPGRGQSVGVVFLPFAQRWRLGVLRAVASSALRPSTVPASLCVFFQRRRPCRYMRCL